jgi:hypothetical protein
MGDCESIFRTMTDDETSNSKAKIKECREKMVQYERDLMKVKREILPYANKAKQQVKKKKQEKEQEERRKENARIQEECKSKTRRALEIQQYADTLLKDKSGNTPSKELEILASTLLGFYNILDQDMRSNTKLKKKIKLKPKLKIYKLN